MRTHKFAIFIAATMVAFLTTTMAALAVPAIAKSAVNVRTGPGINFSRVDTLHRGERVNVTQCQNGWCYVQKSGPNGWVSGNYLLRANTGSITHPRKPAINFGFSINTGGPSFSISIGSPTLPPPPPPPPVPKVCFYDGVNYTGAQFCVDSGYNNNQLTGFWNNRISSFKVFGGASVQLCRNWNYGGTCFGYNSSRARLPFQINNKASSLQTWY